MSFRNVVKVVLLAEAFAVATFALGWWSVPILGVFWALVSSSRRRAVVAGACAAAGWASLLLLDAAHGPVGSLGMKLSGVMRVPGFTLWIFTLLFPALLAWSAAALTPSLRGSDRQASS